MTDIANDLVVNTSIGVPLPPDYHAVSVALPTWNSVVGYEEGNEAVVASMQIGYPRFRFHNQVSMLMVVLRTQRFFELQHRESSSGKKVTAVVVDVAGAACDGVSPAERKDQLMASGVNALLLSEIPFDCMVLPNLAVGFRLKDFLLCGSAEADCTDGQGFSVVSVYQIGLLDYSVVYFPAHWAAKAKCFWQHCGELLSSRQAIQAVEHLQQQLLANCLNFDWWQVPPVDELLERVCEGAEDEPVPSFSQQSAPAVEEKGNCISQSAVQSQMPQLLSQVCMTSRVLHVLPQSVPKYFFSNNPEAALDAVHSTISDPVPAVLAAVPKSKDRFLNVRSVIINRIASVVEEPAHFLRKNVHPALTTAARGAVGGNVPLEEDDDLAECCSNIVLTVSGMSAVYTALRLALRWHAASTAPDASMSAPPHVVVFGFPYLDTLKMMRRKELNPGGSTFFGEGNADDLDALEQQLKEGIIRSRSEDTPALNRIAAVFTEFPSNPLMKCPDLIKLTRMAHEYGFLLIVDDTIANFANCDLLHSPEVQVDVLVSSLTKIFDGRGNVLAGSLIINSLSPATASLQRILSDMQRAHDLPRICREDAVVLERNSRSFLQRSQRSNDNANALAKHLVRHPDVEIVYYPSTSAATSKDMEGKISPTERCFVDRIFNAAQRRNELCFTVGSNPWQLDCEMEKMMAHSLSRGSLAPTASKVDLESLVESDEHTSTVVTAPNEADSGYDVGLALEESDVPVPPAVTPLSCQEGHPPIPAPRGTSNCLTPTRLRSRTLSHSKSIGNLASKMETHRPGYGCLLSIVLKPHASTKVFYDSLEVNKGPSLGTNFTLVCPYTLLAHYNELPWAASYGVPSTLIRISAGVERTEELINTFDAAIATAVAHGPDEKML